MIEKIDKLSKLFAIAGISLIIPSVLYDYFFLYALNLSFNEIPTTIQDHIRSAIIWAPGIGISNCVGIFIILSIYAFLTRNIEPASTTNQSEKQANNAEELKEEIKKVTQKIDILSKISNVYLITYLTMIAFFIVIIIFTKQYFRLYSFIPAIFAFTPLIIKPNKDSLKIITGFVLIMILTMASTSGFTHGKTILNGDMPKLICETRTPNNTIEIIQLLGIRRFSIVSIIIDKDKRVAVIPSDSILKLKQIDSSKQ